MVGPISAEERSSFALKIKIGLTLVVGASAGLISVSGDAPLPFVLGSVLVGLVVGAAIVWFVFPGTGDVRSNRDDRRRRFK